MIGTSVEGWIAGPVTFLSSTGTTIICDEAYVDDDAAAVNPGGDAVPGSPVIYSSVV